LLNQDSRKVLEARARRNLMIAALRERLSGLASSESPPGNSGSLRISPIGLVVRCFAERKGDQWQAFSLEFGLAAQADSEEDAKMKLEEMIESYVRDALIGEDREHAFELLTRRASRRIYFRYFWYRLHHAMAHVSTRIVDPKNHTTYREPLPLEPRHCSA
jgi:hypothetical protein